MLGDKVKISEEIVEIPDGEYYGLWTAYTMTIFSRPELAVAQVKTTVGVRGIRVKTSIVIENGLVYKIIE